ncbi:hypothetical protein E2C01_027046 [Portunus trituberculatus]|uniref:Uncharacterized protein n=1 Tax=Portunus trituberculatus TaxID=210409 RepID=A0A5B7EK47_PORTR|nr:hypothetical protein [Portunus trituberculatus]
MVRNNIYVEEVHYGDVAIKTKKGRKRKIITNTWRADEHKNMQGEVIKCLDNMMKRWKNTFSRKLQL